MGGEGGPVKTASESLETDGSDYFNVNQSDYGCERTQLELGRPIPECVEVALRGCDLRVSQPIHDRFQIGAACKRPGRVRVPQVVEAHVKVEPSSLEGGQPDAGAECVAGQRATARPPS